MGFYNQQIYHEREVMRIMEKFGEPVKACEIAHFCRFMPAGAFRAALQRLVEGKFLVKETVSGKYYALYPSRYYERKRCGFMREFTPIITTYQKGGELQVYGDESLLKEIERELLAKYREKNNKRFRVKILGKEEREYWHYKTDSENTTEIPKK